MTKAMGNYALAINPRLYRLTPKAVFAGIAAGVALNGGVSVSELDTPDAYIAREWCLLFDQQLIDSRPPGWVRRLANSPTSP